MAIEPIEEPADGETPELLITWRPGMSFRDFVAANGGLERQRMLLGTHHRAEYLREQARLSELRAELQSAPAAPTVQLRGVFNAWQFGDGVTRRELLAALFDRLHVSGGKIVGYEARADRQAEVLNLMEALRRRVMNVGGDGLEPTTSSV